MPRPVTNSSGHYWVILTTVFIVQTSLPSASLPDITELVHANVIIIYKALLTGTAVNLMQPCEGFSSIQTLKPVQAL